MRNLQAIKMVNLNQINILESIANGAKGTFYYSVKSGSTTEIKHTKTHGMFNVDNGISCAMLSIGPTGELVGDWDQYENSNRLMSTGISAGIMHGYGFVNEDGVINIQEIQDFLKLRSEVLKMAERLGSVSLGVAKRKIKIAGGEKS